MPHRFQRKMAWGHWGVWGPERGIRDSSYSRPGLRDPSPRIRQEDWYLSDH